MKLKKCVNCNSYTQKEDCPACKGKTKDAHYKFLNFRKFKKENCEFSIK